MEAVMDKLKRYEEVRWLLFRMLMRLAVVHDGRWNFPKPFPVFTAGDQSIPNVSAHLNRRVKMTFGAVDNPIAIDGVQHANNHKILNLFGRN